MENRGVKFIREAIPTKLEKPDPNGRIIVTFKQGDQELTEEYDTVFFAIGRYALTKDLNLDNAGVIAEANGKLKVTDTEETNVPHIFGIGDVIYG